MVSPKSVVSPPKAHTLKPSILPVLILMLNVFQQAIIVLISGPKRGNRTRSQELMIRTMRSIFSSTRLNTQESLYIFLKLIESMPVASNSTLETCTYKEITFQALVETGSNMHQLTDQVIRVKTSLHEKYPVSLNSVLDVHAEWIVPSPFIDTNGDVILYLHGGAFICKPPFGNRVLLAPLATRFKRRIFNLDYRLSPEFQFPVALHEVIAAYLYLIHSEKINPSKIVIMGDSAGGNLAMTASLYLRNHDLPQCGGLVLLSPWADLELDLPSWNENDEYDMISARVDRNKQSLVQMYLGANYQQKYNSEELVSPVLAKPLNNQHLPPIYIATGKDEVLLDDNILLAANLAHNQLSPAIVHDIYVHQCHDFQCTFACLFGPISFLSTIITAIPPTSDIVISPMSVDTIKCWIRIEQFLDLLSDNKVNSVFDTSIVEVCLIKDGVVQSRNIDDTWMLRWNGILSVKKMAWVPDNSVHHIIIPEDDLKSF